MEEKESLKKPRLVRLSDDKPCIADLPLFQEAFTHYDNALLDYSLVHEDDKVLYAAVDRARHAAADALCAIVDAHTARAVSLALADSRAE